MSVFDLLPVIVPHPDLVATKRPSPREVAEYAALMGWLAEPEDRFRAAEVG